MFHGSPATTIIGSGARRAVPGLLPRCLDPPQHPTLPSLREGRGSLPSSGARRPAIAPARRPAIAPARRSPRSWLRRSRAWGSSSARGRGSSSSRRPCAWSATSERCGGSSGFRRRNVHPRDVRRSFPRTSVHLGERLVRKAYLAHALPGGCLPRSLVQYLLHRRDGTGAKLVVGVRRPDRSGSTSGATSGQSLSRERNGHPGHRSSRLGRERCLCADRRGGVRSDLLLRRFWLSAI